MLKEDWDYYLEQDDPGHLSLLLVSAALLSTKPVSYNGMDFGIHSSQVFAQEGTAGTTVTEAEIQAALEEYIRLGKREMNRLCGKDTFVSPSSIERGLKFAQLIGDDTGADMCQKKMCANLDEARSAPEVGFSPEEYKNWVLYQKWCDDSEQKDTEWKNRTTRGHLKLVCTTLIKKNLLNFGDNRVTCHEVLDDKGGIDGYYDDKEVTRQTLRNKGETAPLDKDPGPGFSP